MTRAIFVAGANRGRGAWVPLGVYVAGIRKAKAMPDATFPYGLTTSHPCTGERILHQFRRGMHDRITQAIPYSKRGLTP